jgi:hypothetical protein
MEPHKTQVSHVLSSRVGQRSVPHSEGDRCDLCGASVISLHCKLVCIRCGYKRDCSDP